LADGAIPSFGINLISYIEVLALGFDLGSLELNHKNLRIFHKKYSEETTVEEMPDV
tara:strand:+ start:3658 stop:3825 length:168 start_codon:yes stop_codon:yes gene_type:complete